MGVLIKINLLFAILLASYGLLIPLSETSTPDLVVVCIAAAIFFIIFGFLFSFIYYLMRMKGASFFAFISFLLGIALFAGMGYSYIEFQEYAFINDVSTDLKSPPSFIRDLKVPLAREGMEFVKKPPTVDRSYKNQFASKQRKSYPGLINIFTKLPPDQAFRLARKALDKKVNWQIKYESLEKKHFELEIQSDFFGFIDDMIVQVRPGKKQGSQIVIRSRSRLGKFDFGANKHHIETFSTFFNQLATSALKKNKG